MSSVKCHLGQPKKVCQASFREYIHLAKHQAGLPSPSEKTLDPVISKEPSGEQEPFQPQGVRLSASNHWLLKLPWHTSLNHVNIYYVHLWCVEWKKRIFNATDTCSTIFCWKMVWTKASKKMLSTNPRRFVPLQLDIECFLVQTTTYKPQALC